MGRIISLCCQVLYHNSVSMIVSRLTSFAKNFVIRSHWITPTVPVRLLQEALVILVLKLMSQFRSFGQWLKMLYPIPLSLAALKVIHEKNWKRLGAYEHFHLLDCPWTFPVILADHGTSFLVLPHSYFHFLLMLDAPWELRFPAIVTLEKQVKMSLKSLSINLVTTSGT